jgi:S-(hydroxymethyl)glutathione dehydrogenase/alcohol dehydrogenase
MLKTNAAVTDGQGNFKITEIEVGEPAEGELLVQIKASGICHTDWDSLNWGKQVIMGHEGAGIIRGVGSSDSEFQVGQSVLLNWAIPCESCFQCNLENYALCESEKSAHSGSSQIQGEAIERSFSIGTMSGYSVVKEEAAVVLADNISFAAAAIIGCGVMTGVGSAVNAANIKQGQSVCVLGCGGVGLNVIQGARIAGAFPIIAIDLKDSRLNMAAEFGANYLVKADPSDKGFDQVLAEIKEILGGQACDLGFEATGVPQLAFVPLKLVRNGGQVVQVSGVEQEIKVDMNWFEWDKTYINPLYGKCNPKTDFQRLFEWYTQGDLLLDELISATYRLDQLEQGFSDMLEGKIAKGVILFD